MRTVKQICGEGCMTITEGPWYRLLALWLVDHIPNVPWTIWLWAYDHVKESPWQPGHIGQSICHKCGRDRDEDSARYYRAELVPCEQCRDGGESHV